MNFNVVKGTHDVILEEAEKFRFIEDCCITKASSFGFNEFRTPIIESTNLFMRSVGDSSDIARKEMYTFLDKGNRSITLRPEMTAGVVRSIVNQKLYATQDFPIKAYYCGPNFRYERPQQGRYRQFNQFGVECIGVDNPYRDFEVIFLAYEILKKLGFKTIKLKINSLGDEESRNNYKNALKDYFESKIDVMCPDCKERFNTNILRILDCKVDADKEIIKNAPKIENFLNEESRRKFEIIKRCLELYEIDYEIDHNLVRGLDYYSDIVFEFDYTSVLGKNYGALGGGGHYSKLVEEIGGPKLEGVGFAFGIERLYNVMNDDNLFPEFINLDIDCYVMPLENVDLTYALSIATVLRNYGFRTEICLEKKNISQMIKKATKKGAPLGFILGPDEIVNNTLIIKNFLTQDQTTIDVKELPNFIENLLDEINHADDYDGDCNCCNHLDDDYEEEKHDCCCHHHHHEHGDHDCCNHDNKKNKEEDHDCCCKQKKNKCEC